MNRKLKRSIAAVGAASVLAAAVQRTYAQNVSSPALLQWFENSWQNIEYRTPDLFMAGYGGVWTPPPGRADSGNQSVGYDVYDRFDLGSAGNPTHYGTETGLKTMISQMHTAGGISSYVDLVWNHDGFSQWNSTDNSGHSFLNAGGYPGFVMGTGVSPNFGDFHDPSAGGDENMRLAGLIDIAQDSNNQFVRNPVPGNANNLPAGTVSAYGRLANIPTATNTRFYPDQSQTPMYINDPAHNVTNMPVYPFNNANPLNGTPVSENATGYLMRNAQWLIQSIGADGFRLDATKNYPTWVLNYFDTAVYHANKTPNLDGSQKQVWAFGEDYDGNMSALQSHVLQNINSQPANTVGGNRDTLDFPLYFAMQTYLSSVGSSNDWRNISNASFDVHDDGFANNGSQGVAFVQGADTGIPAPYLSNVAYAYTLMRPGNALVYFNSNALGNSGPFPAQGPPDALGGQNGKTITTLVDIRNRYGTGNYIPRSITSATSGDKEILVYERQDSMIVALNNRIDNGYDVGTAQTSFAAGTPLIELTGNAADPVVNSDGTIPQVVVVNGDGTINFRVPRNKNTNGVEHKKGYVIYGPSGPQSQAGLTETNVAQTIAPDTQNAGNNGTARVTPIHVIKANSFQLSLATNAVTLPGSIRDHDADGDNALIKVDGGIDINGNGHVDYVTPNTVSYGFEEFTTTHTPGYASGNNNGLYTQNIDATQLSEGYHYIEVRAFRHRNNGEPAIYSDFKDVIYVDRLPPVTNLSSFVANGSSTTWTATAQSVDLTANNVHIMLDLGFGLTDAQVQAASGQAGQTDRDLWTGSFSSVGTGNHSLTILTYEIDGNYSIKRIPALFTTTSRGRGLGDTNFNGTFDTTDISGSGSFESVLYSNNTQFNAAADLNADGLVDDNDSALLIPWLTFSGATSPVISTAATMRINRAINTGAALNVLAGTLNVSGTSVPAVPLTVTTAFNIPSNVTIHKTGAGTFNIQGTQSHGINAVLSTEGGTTNIATDGGSSLTVKTSGAGSVTNFQATQHLKAVNIIGTGGLVTLAQGGNVTLVTQSFSIDGGAMPTGQLDLNDNRMIINYTGASPLSTIRSQISAGRGGSGFGQGAWNGTTGITSSVAAAGNGVAAAIGYAENSALPIHTFTSFNGQAVGSSSILIAYTRGADATMDGIVDNNDVTVIGGEFNNPGSGQWFLGDFDYTGICDNNDVTALGGLFDPTAPPFSPAQLSAEFGSSFAAAYANGQLLASQNRLPEPGALTLMAIGGISLLARRRLRKARTSKQEERSIVERGDNAD